MTARSSVAPGVVAWDASSVSTGVLQGAEPVLRQIASGWQDIRGCVSAPDGAWLLVSAIDTASGWHGLWRVDPEGGGRSVLLTAEYLLYAAVDPTGSRVAYTAPPSRSRSDTSLHMLDLDGSGTRLLVEGSVHSSCIPSWRTPDRLLFHTEAREVVEFDLKSRRSRRLSAGEHPAASPDGGRIAYRVGAAVLLTSAGGPPADVSPRQGVLPRAYRDGMSWSPDGRMLLLARSGGALGYELDFLTLDVGTGETVKINQRYLRGMVFMR